MKFDILILAKEDIIGYVRSAYVHTFLKLEVLNQNGEVSKEKFKMKRKF